MRSNYLTHIFEAMNALIAANTMPGIQDSGSSVYIVNKMNNNAFTWGMTIDYKMRHMIEKDPEDKKLKLKDVDNQDQYGFDCSTKIDSIWKVTDKAGLSEALEKIYNNLGNEVSDNFIYETLTGEKMYSMDQIEFSDKVKKITPLDDMIKAMSESIRNYTLYGKWKAELIAEVKYGDKSVSDIITEYRDVLLEFDIKTTIQKVIKKVKVAIYKLLTKLENVLNKAKDSGFKQILLKAIQKLKSLFKKTDEIKYIDEANKIIEEVKEVNNEVNQLSDSSKAMLKAAGEFGKRITIADYILFSTNLADSAVEYLKSIGMDIFESAEKYRQEKGFDIDDVEDPGNLEDIEKTNLIDLYDDIAIKFKSGEGCTKHNYDLMKKLITEYRKRPKEEVKSDWDDDLY